MLFYTGANTTNVSTMRCYFKAPNFGNDMTSYRTRMYELFKIEYPKVSVTVLR